jgi:hypothetical protein
MSEYLSGLISQATNIYNQARKYNTQLQFNKKQNATKQSSNLTSTNTLSTVYNTHRSSKNQFVANSNIRTQQKFQNFSINGLLENAKKVGATTAENYKGKAIANSTLQGNLALRSNALLNTNQKDAIINENVKLRVAQWEKAKSRLMFVLKNFRYIDGPNGKDYVMNKWMDLNPKPAATDVGYTTGKFNSTKAIPLYQWLPVGRWVYIPGPFGMRIRTWKVSLRRFTYSSNYFKDVDQKEVNDIYKSSGRFGLITNLNTQNKEMDEMTKTNNLVHGENLMKYTDQQLANVNWSGVQALKNSYQDLARQRDDMFKLKDKELKLQKNQTRLTSIYKQMSETSKSINIETQLALKQAGVVANVSQDLEKAQLEKLYKIDTVLKVQENQNKNDAAAAATAKTALAPPRLGIKDLINNRAGILQDDKKRKIYRIYKGKMVLLF